MTWKNDCVTLGANRTAGSHNDGYADNLSLTVGR